MVIVKGVNRFYGRSETGNYILTQVEVARLYERRGVGEASVLPLLEEAIKEAPVPDNERFAHLHIVARPVLAADALLDRALSSGKNHKELLTEVLDQISSSGIYKDGYVPDIGHPIQVGFVGQKAIMGNVTTVLKKIWAFIFNSTLTGARTSLAVARQKRTMKGSRRLFSQASSLEARQNSWRSSENCMVEQTTSEW
jgi:hypothetical protein